MLRRPAPLPSPVAVQPSAPWSGRISARRTTGTKRSQGLAAACLHSDRRLGLISQVNCVHTAHICAQRGMRLACTSEVGQGLDSALQARRPNNCSQRRKV